MPGESWNIYKNARRGAGLTQESAAERLGISVESIRAYETGQRTPPDNVVQPMSILYNSLNLCFQHMQENNVVYRSVVPEVEQRSVIEATTKLVNRIFDFADSHADRRLLRIAEDNVIDTSERVEFDAIMEDLGEIVEAALELRCAGGSQ